MALLDFSLALSALLSTSICSTLVLLLNVFTILLVYLHGEVEEQVRRPSRSMSRPLCSLEHVSLFYCCVCASCRLLSPCLHTRVGGARGGGFSGFEADIECLFVWHLGMMQSCQAGRRSCCCKHTRAASFLEVEAHGD